MKGAQCECPRTRTRTTRPKKPPVLRKSKHWISLIMLVVATYHVPVRHHAFLHTHITSFYNLIQLSQAHIVASTYTSRI
jgi:predicted metal-dependent hydrolase